MECPGEVHGDPVKAAEVVRRCGVLWGSDGGAGVTKPWGGQGRAAGEEGACPGAAKGHFPPTVRIIRL